MKIRQGFVSNSSSCSFTIYGTAFDNEKFEDIYNQLTDDIKARHVIESENPKNSHADPMDILSDILEHEFKFYVSSGSDGYMFYVGYGIDDMDDDETKNQFYYRTEETLKKAFKTFPEACWHEESWYDG